MKAEEVAALHRSLLEQAAAERGINLTDEDLRHLAEAAQEATRRVTSPRTRGGEVVLDDLDVRILRRVADGMTSFEASEAENVSISVVDYRLKKAQGFFGTRTTQQNVNAAYAQGVLESPAPLETLTHGLRPKELQLLRLLPTDLGFVAVQAKMGMTEAERKNVQKSLFAKLKAKNRWQAISKAWDCGIFTRDATQ